MIPQSRLYLRVGIRRSRELVRTAFGLSGLALATFYLTGPILIVWELFRPELSIPFLLMFYAVGVLSGAFSYPSQSEASIQPISCHEQPRRSGPLRRLDIFLGDW